MLHMRSYVFHNKIFYGAPVKYAPESKKRGKNLLLALAGLFLGGVNGMFGAGGGMLAVPALAFVGGLDDKSAHATAIAIVLPLCMISSLVYSLRGSFDFAVVVPTVIGVLAGGVIGALLLKKLPTNLLGFIFYGLMMLAGIKMVL